MVSALFGVGVWLLLFITAARWASARSQARRAQVQAPSTDVEAASSTGEVALRTPFRHVLSTSMVSFGAAIARRGFGLETRANPLENPSRPLTDPALLGLLGGQPTTSGVSVTEETSLTIGAVWRAVSLISGTIGALGIEVIDINTRRNVVVKALCRFMPGEMTPFELWETVVLHLLLWGNAYLFKQRDLSGRIVRLVVVHPARVDVEIVNEPDVGQVKRFIVADAAGTSYSYYTTWDILHIPGLNYDGIKGLSPIRLNREMLGVSKAAEQLAAKLFGNGNLLSGVLTSDKVIDQDVADRLKQRWREKMSGVEHAYDIAVLDAGTKFQSLTMPLAESQWLEARTFQVEEVARWFGVPPSMIGEVSKHASQGGGNGIEAQNLAFVQHTLTPWLARIEQRIRAEVLSDPVRQKAEFNLAGLLRGDMAARFNAYAIAVGEPFMTKNEARGFENLEPIDGGDVVSTNPTTPKPATAAA